MGTVKGGGPKGSRGFLHLFDWNRKSRKKLFSVSPESTKQDKRTDDGLSATKLLFADQDETVGVSCMKGSIDCSCASSVTDEEGNGIKAPGVVARLMGLESMPTSGFPEPYSTPLFDTRSLRDKQSLKRSPELFMNDQLNPAWNRTDAYNKKPGEFRTQKMPSSPVERFQTETLPPRSAKPVPLTHHKLLSPIKTPGFISPRNAAHIMEAAAKILEPALPVNNTRAKVSSSYGPLKLREPNDSIAAFQRTPRVVELSRRPVESSDMRYVKGQSLNRSWNGSDDSSSTLRPSTDISDTTSLDGKGKGKSISLAIQAKVNVQRREGVKINSRNGSTVLKDDEEGKLNQPFKSQPCNQKNQQQKKVSLSGGSVVLRQNNQKQNFLAGKGKVTPKQSIANQQGRKNLYRDTSSGKSKTNTKLSGNSRVANRKDSSETCTMECDGFLSSNKDFPQKKRLVEVDFNSERNSCVTPVVRHRKHVQPNVVIDEKSKCSEDKRSDGADVVSFTFTSPLVKSESGVPSSLAVEENCDKRNIYSFDGSFQMNGFASKKLSSQGLNLITGDALSFLLEQKLRQLASGDESYCNYVKATSSTSCAPVQQQKISDNNSLSTNNTGHEKQLKPRTCGGQLSMPFSNGISSTNGNVFGLSYKLQEPEEVECSSSSDARKEPDMLQPSPLSVLEASFSCETCNSSTSTASNKGSRISLHSVQAQNITSSSTQKKLKQFETELELSDSASSLSSSAGTSFSSEDQQNHTKSDKQDLDYVKEALNSRRTSALDLALRPLDLLLFNKLENKRGNNGRMRRKMMFDCVNESLKNKRNRFLRSGFKAWANAEAIIKPNGMAEDIYEEILGWKGFGDCMIDELVDRDMSSYRGRWVDFEMEAFELGMEMENEIICSFIDEFVADCFIVQV